MTGVVWQMSFGATVETECDIGEMYFSYPMLGSADFEPDAVFANHAPNHSQPLTFDAMFTSEGAVDGPYPGYPFIPDDEIGPVIFDFELGLSPTGSFVFPSDFDGASEASIDEGGRGPLKGMAFQDPANVDIDGGVIRNVTLTGISIDGGNF